MFLKSILPPSIPSWRPLSYSSRIISNLWVIKADRITGLRGPVLAGHGGRAHPSLDSNVVRVQLAPAFIVVASWQWWQLICAPLIYGCIFHKVGKCELSSRFLIFLRLRFLRCTTQHSFAGQATQYAGARELCPPFVNHLDVSLIGRPLASTKRTGKGGGFAKENLWPAPYPSTII